ncbi:MULTISPECIES: TonB-dependent receptor domain-containing protein [unclassified Sphingomonas]|uniref:TonB-dependent receptor n=1 Tax=Sphingomonas TaxID=13687 RepID=UPI000AF44006
MAWAPAFALLLALPSSPARAQRTTLSIPATTLDQALLMLSRQTGVEIISTEAGLSRVRTVAVSGVPDLATALSRLLAGTGYKAERASHGYRIVRARIAPAPAPSRPKQRPKPAPAPATEPAESDEIVVEANKQRVPLLRYPGSLTMLRGSEIPAPSGNSLSDIAASTPILQSTLLGPGRNKVFIRGVADSSFNGSTQSPTSVYFDDVQLNYSGPDAGLRLYDMRSVEVLEGPQGTLYGSGAIGGVIRLTSNPASVTDTSASMIGGATATDHSEPGFDLAGIVNMPVIRDRLGLRAVAYRVRDGGYIDDAKRGLHNTNRIDTVGGRLALRLAPGNGWRVEASGAIQSIDMRDGQYSDVAGKPLVRYSRLAQPFHSALWLGRVVASKDWDSGLRLIIANGIVAQHSVEQFDASPRGSGPTTQYRADRNKLLVSHETRLSRSLGNGNSWVAGFTLVSDRDILSRALEISATDRSLIGVTNVSRAASLFGEASFAVFDDISLTLGARATMGRNDGEPSSTPRGGSFTKGRSTHRVDPTLAFSWRLAPTLALFGRFQTSYRTGGLAVAAGTGRVADYLSDVIQVGEIGIRKLRAGPTGLAFSLDLSTAHWSNIQADLITQRGQPYTANIGDARIRAIEANFDWVPVSGLHAGGSIFFTANRVIGPIANASKRDNRRLPETPPLAAVASLSYSAPTRRFAPRFGVTANYVGRSVLGTGDFLDISQGRYWVIGASAGARIGRIELSLDVDNLLNAAANRFAFGNPFTLVVRDQATPLRPRSARLGMTVNW